MLCHLSHVPLFATPWTIACKALLFMGFSRQKHWSGLPCPPLGNLPDPGINSCLLGLLHWQAGFFTTSTTWDAQSNCTVCHVGDLGLIPGLGRSPGVGNANPLQYSCLENPMNRGAWQATVHGVTKYMGFSNMKIIAVFSNNSLCGLVGVEINEGRK